MFSFFYLKKNQLTRATRKYLSLRQYTAPGMWFWILSSCTRHKTHVADVAKITNMSIRERNRPDETNANKEREKDYEREKA